MRMSGSKDWLEFGGLLQQQMFLIATDSPFKTNIGIEGEHSQDFSVGIFYFLVFAIFVFTAVVFMFMFKDKGASLKSGEKWLFAWLLLGILVAVVFGATQLLHGVLF